MERDKARIEIGMILVCRRERTRKATIRLEADRRSKILTL
jgi:hypothetical protein